MSERTIDWARDAVVLIDQWCLPHEVRRLEVREVEELCAAIVSMRVRGALALGAAGALGVALGCVRGRDRGEDVRDAAHKAAESLRATRPTAVNLARGVERALQGVPDVDAVVARATEFLEEDECVTAALAHRGADLLEALLPREASWRVLTHCNAGALACVSTGTALGVIGAAYERYRVREVVACESRPLLQGTRLTAWELQRAGIPYRLIVDGAAAGLIVSRGVDAVVVGADRIAANGDTANKVGTLGHALAARHAGVPFIVAAPESTIDPSCATGASIPIEERGEDEVLGWAGRRVAAKGVRAWNPAFDVTPGRLVTAIVTEERVIRPSSLAGPTTGS